VETQYAELKRTLGTYTSGSNAGLPKIAEAKQVADAVLTLSTTSNGKLNMTAWEVAEEEHGVDLKDIGAGYAQMKMNFKNITAQPAEAYPTPIGTSAKKDGARYNPFSLHKERLVPFRTLTGRQSFYIDHEIFREFGEALTTFKPGLPPRISAPQDTPIKPAANGKELTLRYMTPHGKWNIHTMYQDNIHMLTLFRGGPVVWISDVDARKADIKDNDWVEVYNRNGVLTCRAVVSHRMPEGTLYSYHGQDATVQAPRSNITGNRGGSHNAPIQIHIKPTQMVGGYAQLSYAWNYYGPCGVNRDTYCKVRKLDEVKWNED
jgi:nitrate reductase alpha subunit